MHNYAYIIVHIFIFQSHGVSGIWSKWYVDLTGSVTWSIMVYLGTVWLGTG